MTIKKKRKKKHSRKPAMLRARTPFAPIFPAHQGTPLSPGACPAAVAAISQVSSRNLPTKDASLIIQELKQIFGQVSESASAIGYSGPHALSASNLDSKYAPVGGSGGKYNFADSPGIGLRSAQGWKVWRCALDLMDSDKVLPKAAIVLAAFNKAGVSLSRLDASEVRLIEMGVEWYLSNNQVPRSAGEAPVGSAGRSGWGGK